MRKATFVGGIATGALLFAGTAAEAADAEADQADLDDVQAAPELLGGLPNPTGAVPGLDGLPVDSAPGLDTLAPSQTAPAPADARTDQTDMPADQGAAPAGSPVDDLLGDLGGGLPVPLPF